MYYYEYYINFWQYYFQFLAVNPIYPTWMNVVMRGVVPCGQFDLPLTVMSFCSWSHRCDSPSDRLIVSAQSAFKEHGIKLFEYEGIFVVKYVLNKWDIIQNARQTNKGTSICSVLCVAIVTATWLTTWWCWSPAPWNREMWQSSSRGVTHWELSSKWQQWALLAPRLSSTQRSWWTHHWVDSSNNLSLIPK